MMVKRVVGLLVKKNTTGYRPVWDMGRAADIKKMQKTTGINRPST